MDLDALSTKINNENKAPTDLPTLQEILYFAFIIICVYLTLWSILVTTTNTAIQGIMAILFTIANFAIFLTFAYYIAKLLASGVNYVMQRQ
jgi:flagellar biosynthesis protein FlhB